jgi:hypothetical protein
MRMLANQSLHMLANQSLRWSACCEDTRCIQLASIRSIASARVCFSEHSLLFFKKKKLC